MSKYDKYKESAFTHEEMQTMKIETDMTDIVERLHGKVPMAWGDEGFMLVDEDAVLATFTEAADEIERLRKALSFFFEMNDDGFGLKYTHLEAQRLAVAELTREKSDD